jgi:glycerol-1-phosphate dehydrogenase [NAD(P)+]
VSSGPASIAVAEDLDGLRGLLAREPGLRELGLGGVVIAPGAIARVPAICVELAGDRGRVAMICDRREMAGPRGEVKASLLAALAAEGLEADQVLVGDDDSRTHADAGTIAAAADLCRAAAALVSVGSGTVADVGKAVSAQLDGRPHVVVQTAASVNGFADDMSVLLRDGVKRTTPTRWPDRLVIDTEVVARAPAELNRAGLGDLLAGYTAPADWLLARLVGQDDSYCETVVQLARAHVDPVLEVAAGIGGGDPAAIGPLSAGLTLSGISMGVAGATAPGSGMEHTVSHLLEMAHDPSTPEAWHGAKVGALSVLASLLWTRMRAAATAGALRELRFPSAEEMHDRVLAAFARLDGSGAMGEECWRDYSAKLERWLGSRDQLRSLPERWPAFDARLDGLLAPATRLADALRAAGAPLRLGELGIDDETGRWALANCHLMRDRFTVADLAFLTGRWEESDVRELLDEAATIGAGS